MLVVGIDLAAARRGASLSLKLPLIASINRRNLGRAAGGLLPELEAAAYRSARSSLHESKTDRLRYPTRVQK